MINWYTNLLISKKMIITFAVVFIFNIAVVVTALLCPISITISVVAVVAIIEILNGILLTKIISHPLKRAVAYGELVSDGRMDLESIYIPSDLKLGNRNDEIGTLINTNNRLFLGERALSETAKKIAEGDMTIDVKLRSKRDELGISLSELVNKLNDVINTIVNAAEQISNGSFHVLNSSTALSQGATEQASAVEELTVSLEQILSQTNVNAQNASVASELVKSMEFNAIKGKTQMGNMLVAMYEINASSNKISKIIKVIDDIAFQTNILALNAAVEAARAGQHGKGFAVVAEEVRNLAMRSADAARETTEMIEDSIRNAETGTKIAQETDDALKQISVQVQKAAELVNKIAIASQEQAYNIAQINQGVIQVSNVVQTNAATAEENTASSEELSEQATRLNEIVRFFKINKTCNIKALL